MTEGKYIYCITKRIGGQNLGSVGINNGEVGFLPHRDIAAVVSSTPIINFDRLNKQELTKYVAIHQKVNELIMKETDIVPLTFGIIAPSPSEVERILEGAYLQFKSVLKKITGKAEFVVPVWWDQATISELLALPLDEQMGAMRGVYIKDIQTILGEIASDCTLNKLITEDMLANFSFLIERTRESALDRKMQELGEKYEGQLRFKYIGPLPPYSFSHINLGLGNFKVVDEARKILGLGEETTLDEIKKTYRALSHRWHPDKGGDEMKFKAIAQAYDVLETYCHSQGKTNEQKCSFRENDVKNSVIILKGRP